MKKMQIIISIIILSSLNYLNAQKSNFHSFTVTTIEGEEISLEQFKGKKGPFHIVAEGESDGENEFEAITGATITTTAVKEMTDGACEKVQKLRSQINR